MIAASISVIIPLYNREDFIIETLESVEKQTLQPAEVIVVDDFSTDKSVDVVRAYMTASALKIRVMTNIRAKGQSGATNTAILATDQKYIALHDSDDLWEPDHLRNLHEMLESEPDIGIGFSGFDFFGDPTVAKENKSVFRSSVSQMLNACFLKEKAGYWISNDNLLESILNIGFSFRCPASLMRVSILRETGVVFDEKLSYTMDSHFSTLMAYYTRFGYVEAIGLRIRKHRENIAPGFYGKKIATSYRRRIAGMAEFFQSKRLSPAQKISIKRRMISLEQSALQIELFDQKLMKKIKSGIPFLLKNLSIQNGKFFVKEILFRK